MRHALDGQKCTCGWAPALGTSVTREFDKHLLSIVHSAHFHDGYPLCWTYDDDGPHVSSYNDSEVTCPDCLGYMRDSEAT